MNPNQTAVLSGAGAPLPNLTHTANEVGLIEESVRTLNANVANLIGCLDERGVLREHPVSNLTAGNMPQPPEVALVPFAQKLRALRRDLDLGSEALRDALARIEL